MVPWCSGLTCGPVKAEIAGSNPVGTAMNEIKEPSFQLGSFAIYSNFTFKEVSTRYEYFNTSTHLVLILSTHTRRFYIEKLF